MAEFNFPAEQTVQPGKSALLNNTTCGCNKGYITHSNGFGGITIKGAVNNPNACFARYEAKYSANIALAEGATVGEIDLAFALNGEVMQDTVASANPAATGEFWNVSAFKTIDVPRGCCPMIAVENASPSDGTTPEPAIVVRNLNVSVNRIA